MQIKIKCDRCKEEIYLPLFFKDMRINTRQYMPHMTTDYIAAATGTGICYCCGNQITKTFESVLSDCTIIKLATKGAREDE